MKQRPTREEAAAFRAQLNAQSQNPSINYGGIAAETARQALKEPFTNGAQALAGIPIGVASALESFAHIPNAIMEARNYGLNKAGIDTNKSDLQYRLPTPLTNTAQEFSNALVGKPSSSNEQIARFAGEIGGAFTNPVNAVKQAYTKTTAPIKEIISKIKKPTETLASPIDTEAVKAFQKAGITPLPGDISKSNKLKGIQNTLAQTPGTKVSESLNKRAEEITDGLTRNLLNSKVISKEEGGKLFNKGAAARIDDLRNKSGKLYDEAYKNVDMKAWDTDFEPTVKLIDKTYDAVTSEAQAIIDNAVVNSFKKATTQNQAPMQKITKEELIKKGKPAEQMPHENLYVIPKKSPAPAEPDIYKTTVERTPFTNPETGEIIDYTNKLTMHDAKIFKDSLNGQINDNWNKLATNDKRRLKLIVNSIQRQMDNTIATRYPDNAEALKKANSFWEIVNKDGVRDIINKFSTSKNEFADYNKIFGNFKRGNLKEYNTVTKNLSGTDSKNILNSFRNELGQLEGEFSPEHFLKQFKKLPANSKNLIMKDLSTNNKSKLNHIFKVIEKTEFTPHIKPTIPKLGTETVNVGNILRNIYRGFSKDKMDDLLTDPKYIQTLYTLSKTSKPKQIDKVFNAKKDVFKRMGVASINELYNLSKEKNMQESPRKRPTAEEARRFREQHKLGQ